jgi:hypothetical protein
VLLQTPRVIKNWKYPICFSMPEGIYRDNSSGRRFLSHEDAPFRDEAFAAFGITETMREPQFRNFVGNHYADGAATHAHKDGAPVGYVHTRCNWMVKKPISGGDPILDGVVELVEEGDLWICFASLEVHGSTPIAGGERLIQSFGALVPITALSHILLGKP